MLDKDSSSFPSSSMPAGVYLHWPFCERKCPYCDFYTFGKEHPLQQRSQDYLNALREEIESAPERVAWAGKPEIDTVYFGGGTPSLMGPEALGTLLQAVGRVFDVRAGAEITLEVNPTTAETAQLGEMLARGVNRLSVGVQSFNDRILKALGRVHDAQTTRQAIRLMRESFTAAGRKQNLSLDIIFGTPGQTMAEFRADLDELLSHEPEHVSAYGMTIHEGTPFARWEREGRLPLPGEEEQALMYEWLLDRLADGGYEHYEISNWAKPGLHSRHNSKYWRDVDVFGFGVAAHGVDRRRRYANPANLEAYLDPARRQLAQPQPPPANDRARRGEVMMLALRRVAGVNWREINEWMGNDARAFYAPELKLLAEQGLIDADEEGIRLTRAGLLVADSVMESFF